MKKMITAFCIVAMVFTSFSFAFAEGKPVVLKEASEGAGFLTIEGEEAETLRDRDVIFDTKLGQVFFSKEITNYLLDQCDGALTISYMNMNASEEFIYEDYLFVGSPLFVRKDGSGVTWDEPLGKMNITVNLDYPIEKERKLTYYCHEDMRGDRKEMEAAFNKEENSVTFDVSGDAGGFYAVYYDDPVLTGRPEEKMSLGMYLAVGAAVLLIICGISIFLYKKRKSSKG